MQEAEASPLTEPARYAMRMIKNGTLCYVVTHCVASPKARCAVGKIVEVVAGPYAAPDCTYLPGAYYDVRYRGTIYYCRGDKLRPISDPDADVGEIEGHTFGARE